MLQTKVKLDPDVTDFLDNRHEVVPSEQNQKLKAADVKQFQLVGVLVGGQNHQMGWNYVAKNTTSDEWSYVIYDNMIPGTGEIPTPEGEENYTLVFDNYIPQAAQTTDVYVALEFKNNGKDFYGIGNMIRSGGTFYLVGKLTLANATNTSTFAWPTKYAIPPYTDAGASQEVKRVFIQDFKTIANFTISADGLKKAYSSIPELRSTQILFGLSVDLTWKSGVTFDVEI
jgi:hypothetical protein